MDRAVNDLCAAQESGGGSYANSPQFASPERVSATVPLVYSREIPQDIETEYLEALRVRSRYYLPLALPWLSSF